MPTNEGAPPPGRNPPSSGVPLKIPLIEADYDISMASGQRCSRPAVAIWLRMRGLASKEDTIWTSGGAASRPPTRCRNLGQYRRRAEKGEKKPRHAGGVILKRVCDQAFLRRAKPSPASAIPINASVAGSGTAVWPAAERLYV